MLHENSKLRRPGFLKIQMDASDRSEDWCFARVSPETKMVIYYPLVTKFKTRIGRAPEMQHEVPLRERAWAWGSGGLAAIAATRGQALLLLEKMGLSLARPIS